MGFNSGFKGLIWKSKGNEITTSKRYLEERHSKKTRMCKSVDWIRLPQERDGNVKMVLHMDRKHSFRQQTVLEMGMQII